MTREEFVTLTAVIKAFYPWANFFQTQIEMSAWYDVIGDLDANIAKTAVQKWVATESKPPTVAEIRRLAAEITMGDKPAWGDGWEQVQRAMRNYGPYDTEKAIGSMDDITAKVVRRLGWKELCLSDNVTADRANFRMVYEQESEKKVEAAQLPESVRMRIEAARPKEITGGCYDTERD